jgi:hypothetical protein
MPRPCHSPTLLNGGTLPTCRQWTADANSHISCHSPAVVLRGRFQNGIFVAWHGNGMAFVNQTRPHYVNQMGKTQSKPSAERHGNVMGTSWYVWIRLYSVQKNLLPFVEAAGSSETVNLCQTTRCHILEDDGIIVKLIWFGVLKPTRCTHLQRWATSARNM